ncbi:MAG: hypothetical protein L0271_20600 [Gemmatimonadetes bacterium]|nr:hypothetical protein [Gemmatimonadota bacterium]
MNGVVLERNVLWIAVSATSPGGTTQGAILSFTTLDRTTLPAPCRPALDMSSGQNPVAAQCLVGSIAPATTAYFRARAANAGGLTIGSIQTSPPRVHRPPSSRSRPRTSSPGSCPDAGPGARVTLPPARALHGVPGRVPTGRRRGADRHNVNSSQHS